MSKKNILLAITNGLWLIEREYALLSGGIVAKILSGEEAYSDDTDTEKDKLPVGLFTVSPQGQVSFGNWKDPFQNATPGSTAVIGISGPILKYDNCGDPGTKSYQTYLKLAERNNNITSVLLVIDSPGGTVDGTQELAQTVKSFKKPVVSLVDGLMASAAYWIGSSADYVVANNETAQIGSIGTMISFADMQPMYEKAGVKFHTIYADASKDKNKDFEEARAGNYAKLKEKLNAINDLFVSSVKDNRQGIKDTALTGKVFLAKDAIDEKLIDAIGDFDFAVSKAQELAGATSSNKNSNQANMKSIKLLAVHAALLTFFGAKIESGKDSVDVEATDENINKLNSALADAQKNSELLTAANDKIKELETSLDAKSKELTTAQEKVTELGKLNPGATNTIINGVDKLEGEEKNSYLTEADERLAEVKKAVPDTYK